ncbi:MULTISPECIES: hypothetical protein [Arthrobacter]|uniref:Uncharacterized protein n=1 Tax=Arthrobacter terricola TaxID=2547396 RepID=A0A4V2ZSA8_9MICC|nr:MULTISPECIES: hypothetical protein [Arthrobacter]MBT8162786.1 hypothetical protein [Arthrobacter sp. GN70]TDF92054.1 hypothetical protein E1809_18920 [Arthrobacter terricola]
MDSTQQFVLALLSIGGGMATLEIIKGLIKLANGTAGRERIRNVTLKDQRNEAWADAEKERTRADRMQARADREARNRNRLADYASSLRRDCTEHGMDLDKLRAWPVLEAEPVQDEERG